MLCYQGGFCFHNALKLTGSPQYFNYFLRGYTPGSPCRRKGKEGGGVDLKEKAGEGRSKGKEEEGQTDILPRVQKFLATRP